MLAGVPDINAAADSKGNTALMLAVSFYDNTFKLLLAAGAHLDIRNNEGQTVYDILLENIKDMEKVFATSPTKEAFEQWGSSGGREGTFLYCHYFEPSLQSKLASLVYFASVMKDKASSD